MGVLAGGHKAVFALAAGVTPLGSRRLPPAPAGVLGDPAERRSDRTDHRSEPPAASRRSLILRLVAIRSSITHSQSTALAAYERHSAAGLCDLDLAAPMSYSQSNGTLSGAAGAACKNQPAQIPFPSAPRASEHRPPARPAPRRRAQRL